MTECNKEILNDRFDYNRLIRNKTTKRVKSSIKYKKWSLVGINILKHTISQVIRPLFSGILLKIKVC